MQNKLQTVIEEHLVKGNNLSFPSSDDEISTMAINVNTPTDCHFLVYDVRRSSVIRKVGKSKAESAFTIDASGRHLVFAEGSDLHFKLIRLPQSPTLVEMLRPRY
jgi:hypothetical protein